MDTSAKHTFTYSVVNGVPLTLDVYLPMTSGEPSVTNTSLPKLPLLVFWHGGSLTGLSKDWVPKWLFNDALDAGFAVISANYSLLSPATAHDILADVKAFHSWLSASLNVELSSLGSPLVDLDRMAVAGASAGAYVTQLSSIHASPKPRALFALYGMGGDLLHDQYVVPKTEPWLAEFPFTGHPRTLKPLIAGAAADVFREMELTKEQLYDAGSGAAIMDRINYGVWQMETATVLDAMTGLSGLSARLAKLPYDERAPAVPVEHRGLFPQLAPLTKDAPPLIMVHGKEDTMVLPAESEAMKKRYDEAGAKCELVWVAEQDHAWEWMWTESQGELKKVVPFLVEHTK